MARTASECMSESGQIYHEPFNEIELDVVFRDADGKQQRVPAFWAGGGGMQREPANAEQPDQEA